MKFELNFIKEGFTAVFDQQTEKWSLKKTRKNGPIILSALLGQISFFKDDGKEKKILIFKMIKMSSKYTS